MILKMTKQRVIMISLWNKRVLDVKNAVAKTVILRMNHWVLMSKLGPQKKTMTATNLQKEFAR